MTYDERQLVIRTWRTAVEWCSKMQRDAVGEGQDAALTKFIGVESARSNGFTLDGAVKEAMKRVGV